MATMHRPNAASKDLTTTSPSISLPSAHSHTPLKDTSQVRRRVKSDFKDFAEANGPPIGSQDFVQGKIQKRMSSLRFSSLAYAVLGFLVLYLIRSHFDFSATPPQKEIGLEGYMNSMMSVAENMDFAKKHADRSAYYGTLMSTGESGVHLLKNRVRSNSLEERERIAESLDLIGESLRYIMSQTSRIRARAVALSDIIHFDLLHMLEALEDVAKGTQNGGREHGAKFAAKYLRTSIGAHEKIQEQLSDEERLGLALNELQKRLFNLPNIDVPSEATAKHKDLRSRQRKPLTRLWEALELETLSALPEINAENVALLERVESHVDDILQDVHLSKVHLEQADAHYRLLKENSDSAAAAWDFDDDTLRRTIRILEEFFQFRKLKV